MRLLLPPLTECVCIYMLALEISRRLGVSKDIPELREKMWIHVAKKLDDERRSLAMQATLRTSRRGYSGAAVRVVSTSSRLRHISPFVVNIISTFLRQCK
jgi:hypothetical protein